MRRRTNRRGVILIYALWVVIVITAMVLIMAQRMRVEAIAQANRLASAQAGTAEHGMEQYAIGAVAAEVASPGSTLNWSMASVAVGDCRGWLIKPDPDDEAVQRFGLTDEAGKLDINTINPSSFTNMPGMTQEMADSLVNWRLSPISGQSDGGMDDSYYASLPDPYHSKHAPFESVNELLLVRGFDKVVLYGNDRKRVGYLSDQEIAASAIPAVTSMTGYTSRRGMFPFLTVYGVQAAGPAFRSSTNQIIDLNYADVSPLRSYLTQTLGGSESDRISQITAEKQPFRNIFDWAYRTKMTQQQLSQVIDRVIVFDSPRHAKVNINNAAASVLNCIPNLPEQTIPTIVAHRTQFGVNERPADISWLYGTIDKPLLSLIGAYLTGRSYCYSADIVVLSGDGRAFKRCRIVIDGSMSPPSIIYREDLTHLGWPLDANIRENTRSRQD